MKISTTSQICVGVLAAVAAISCAQTPQDEQPNVLFIILDDAGYNDFGFMGCPDLDTPNIDALAEDGTIFTDGHVSASVSGPSRAGILTGRYQQRGGYECNLGDEYGLELGEKTMGDIFGAAGYQTACFGKWHQGDPAEYHPNKRGFDYFYGFVAGSRSYFYRPKSDDKPGGTHALQLNGEYQAFDGYLTDVLADNAASYIKERAAADEPFMAYLAFNAVHTPMEATKEDLARYEGHPRKVLAAMTWAMDRGIGVVIDQLKESGVYDNTIIFFISDNGGAHNNQSCNAPLKGFKGNKFEGGHRVPYFMVYGDRFKGERYDGLVSSMDMLPTAMALAGVEACDLKGEFDGVDLTPYLEGRVEGEPHDILFWRKEEMAAVRMGDYKVIRVEEVGTRMYDLGSSVAEDTDIQTEKPEIYAEMIEKLEAWESELVNPILWGEGVWNLVTRQIHSDLMNNKPVSCYSPEQYEKVKAKEAKAKK